jgi:hypothetical protein
VDSQPETLNFGISIFQAHTPSTVEGSYCHWREPPSGYRSGDNALRLKTDRLE